MFTNPNTGKVVHFGRLGYSDFIEHRDQIRRNSYRKRHTGILDRDGVPAYKIKYSPACAAFNILW